MALHVHVQVYYNGRITWTPPALYCSSCGVKVNINTCTHTNFKYRQALNSSKFAPLDPCNLPVVSPLRLHISRLTGRTALCSSAPTRMTRRRSTYSTRWTREAKRSGRSNWTKPSVVRTWSDGWSSVVNTRASG